MIRPNELFDIEDPIAADLFAECEFVWDALGRIGDCAHKFGGRHAGIEGSVADSVTFGDGPIYVAKTAVVEPGVHISGPCYIGPGVLVRHAAYIRGNVIMLENSLLGHVGEAKNAVFLRGARAPHFAYVGDSILGKDVNLGAGTKLSNLTITSDRDPDTGRRPSIVIRAEGHEYDTHREKFGAILGDRTQTGCNAVLNPGVVFGKDGLIYPNMSVAKGIYPPSTILKLRQNVEVGKNLDTA